MKIKKSIFIAFLITISSLTGQVVKEKCLTNFVKNEKLKNNPSLAIEYAKIEMFTQQWISDNKNRLSKTNAVVQIPVFVHVI